MIWTEDETVRLRRHVTYEGTTDPAGDLGVIRGPKYLAFVGGPQIGQMIDLITFGSVGLAADVDKVGLVVHGTVRGRTGDYVVDFSPIPKGLYPYGIGIDPGRGILDAFDLAALAKSVTGDFFFLFGFILQGPQRRFELKPVLFHD